MDGSSSTRVIGEAKYHSSWNTFILWDVLWDGLLDFEDFETGHEKGFVVHLVRYMFYR